MSEEGPFHTYTFNGHRDALYRLLEATVRGEAGCPDAACDNRPRSREVEQAPAYPSPFLWYDDIRPSDIDAYHAANGRDRYGNDNGARLEDSLVGPIATPMDASEKRTRSHVVALKGSARTGEEEAALDLRRPTGEALSLRRRAEEAFGDRQAIAPGPAGSTSSTPDRCMRAVAPTQPPPSSARHRSHRPHEKASNMPDAEREEDEAGAVSTGSSSAHDACCSKPLEKNDCHPVVMMTAPAATTAVATTPPDPSQATQTTFLPGLPSQVLVTQQQGGDAGWEHPEGDESSQKEEDTAASEHAFIPLPTRPSSAEEDAPVEASAVAPAGGKEPPGSDFQVPRLEPNSSKKIGGSNNSIASVGGIGEGEEASSRQHDHNFTVALKDFMGEVAPDAQQSPVPSSGGGGGGGGERLVPPFKYVPTLEVLPSGWSGGQAGAVAVLEKHLSHARARFPGGYAARALQLACHALRQPEVCIRVRGNRGRIGVVAGGAAAEDGGHHEVVGVAAFVWGILRADGGGDGSSVAAS